MPAPGVETKIWMALKTRLLTFADASVFAFPGEVFTPRGRYIRVGYVLNRPERILISGTPHIREGLLGLTVCEELSSIGEPSLNLAASLADHFPVDLSLRYQDICVRVLSEPHVTGGFQDGGHWQIPVNVTWQCFA